jgi:hypothetical protein
MGQPLSINAFGAPLFREQPLGEVETFFQLADVRRLLVL